MKPVRATLTYLGIAVVAAGFAVILVTWGIVAGMTAVPLQLPYLLSGGLTGIGLVMTGLTVVSVNAKRLDAAARQRQLGQVREVLAEIKSLLVEGPPAADAAPSAADSTEPIPPLKV